MMRGYMKTLLRLLVFSGFLLQAHNASAWTEVYNYYATVQQARDACTAWRSGSACTLNGTGAYWTMSTWRNNFIADCSGRAYSASTTGRCQADPFTEAECTSQGGFQDGAGNCQSTPACTGGKSWNGSACVCTGGQVDVGGTCGAEPPCSIGKSWDEVAQACDFPDTPPTCGANEIAVVNGSGAVVSCAPTADVPDECDYSLGYGADGYFLCSDQKSECEAGGGTHGYIDGSEVCVPDDYSPPLCDSTQVAVLDAGGFVCSTPATVKPQNPDDVSDPSNPPTVPPESSTNTSGQSAAPGTGTSGGGSGGTGTPEDPAAEAHEGTPEAGKTGQGRASGDCSAPPVCSGGDPQMCALLRQQWETMCAQPDMLEVIDGNQSSVIVSRLSSGIDSVFSEQGPTDVVGTVSVDPTGGVGSASEMGWFDSFVSDLVPSGTSCTAYSMNMPRVVLTFGCERLDWLKSFLGWMLYCYTVFFVWGTIFAPYRAPAGD